MQAWKLLGLQFRASHWAGAIEHRAFSPHVNISALVCVTVRAAHWLSHGQEPDRAKKLLRDIVAVFFLRIDEITDKIVRFGNGSSDGLGKRRRLFENWLPAPLDFRVIRLFKLWLPKPPSYLNVRRVAPWRARSQGRGRWHRQHGRHRRGIIPRRRARHFGFCQLPPRSRRGSLKSGHLGGRRAGISLSLSFRHAQPWLKPEGCSNFTLFRFFLISTKRHAHLTRNAGARAIAISAERGALDWTRNWRQN